MSINVLAFIPARGGSKGIVNKNLADLNGKALIDFSLESALASKCITSIFVSSDSIKIIDHCRVKGVDVEYQRPDNLALDDSKSLDVVLHGLDWLKENKKYEPDFVILLQPTSPLRSAKQIDEAFALLVNKNADSLVSVVEVPHNCIPESIMKIEDGKIISYLKTSLSRRQDKPKYYARNGAAIYIFKPQFIRDNKVFFDESTVPYLMSKEDSFDIDDALDLKICSMILKERNLK